MTKPTYDELVAEVKRLRAKLSFGEDEDFTTDVLSRMPTRSQFFNGGYIKGDRITIRPADLWELMLDANPSTRDLAKLGRSLQALGWARSARLGNLVFTLPVEELQR